MVKRKKKLLSSTWIICCNFQVRTLSSKAVRTVLRWWTTSLHWKQVSGLWFLILRARIRRFLTHLHNPFLNPAAYTQPLWLLLQLMDWWPSATKWSEEFLPGGTALWSTLRALEWWAWDFLYGIKPPQLPSANFRGSSWTPGPRFHIAQSWAVAVGAVCCRMSNFIL